LKKQDIESDVVLIDQQDLSSKRQIGLIAQEVEKIIPEVVVDSETSGKGISYGNLVALLIEAIKQLKEEVDELRNQK
jgi:hypothetical protein